MPPNTSTPALDALDADTRQRLIAARGNCFDVARQWHPTLDQQAADILAVRRNPHRLPAHVWSSPSIAREPRQSRPRTETTR